MSPRSPNENGKTVRERSSPGTMWFWPSAK